MHQPGRTALLLRKPGLSGNLLLCQLSGTGRRHDYKGIFPSFKRKKKSPQLIQIWEDYLNHLAFAMKNLNLVIDAPIIISGYLAPYFTEEDTDYLLEQINSMTPFELERRTASCGNSWAVYAGQSGLHYFMWRNLSTRFNSEKSMQNM